MKYKAIFSDIDGTLLNSKYEASKDTVKMIKKIDNMGIKFILVSGRMPKRVISIQNMIGINAPIICFNGSLILGEEKEDGTRDVIKNAYMNVSDAKIIYNIIKNEYPDISFSLYQQDEWFAEEQESKWMKFESKVARFSPKIKNFDLLLQPGKIKINKLLFIGELNRINELRCKLEELFPKLTVSKSQSNFLEVTQCDACKSFGIKTLQNFFNMKKEEIFAIGDNFNDIDMLEYAKTGIAMGNSPDEVKEVANGTTESNDNDGLKKALEKYFCE